MTRDGLPVALIDWEFAGPVDPLVELAQTCWLNAKLHDDIVAEREGLPPLAVRARQLRAIVDAYGLPADQRHGFVDHIIAYVISDTANEADDAGITSPETTSHPAALGAMARRRLAATTPPPAEKRTHLTQTADQPAGSRGRPRSFESANSTWTLNDRVVHLHMTDSRSR